MPFGKLALMFEGITAAAGTFFPPLKEDLVVGNERGLACS